MSYYLQRKQHTAKDKKIFGSQINIFLKKWYLYSKQQYKTCGRYFLVMFSGFVR